VKRLDQGHPPGERPRLPAYRVLHTIDLPMVNLRSSIVSGLLLATFLSPPALAAGALAGRVIQIHDGDTLEVMVGGKRLRLRLAGIAAPRPGQAYSLRSRQSLIALCGGETAAIDPAGKDRSGLMLAQVRCNGIDASGEQLRLGMARVSEHQGGAGPKLEALEHEARTARRGLWAPPVKE
jgi:endonuclease YncB( thermonuclease family)